MSISEYRDGIVPSPESRPNGNISERTYYCVLEQRAEGRHRIGEKRYSSTWPNGQPGIEASFEMVSMGRLMGFQEFNRIGELPDKIEVRKAKGIITILLPERIIQLTI